MQLSDTFGIVYDFFCAFRKAGRKFRIHRVNFNRVTYTQKTTKTSVLFRFPSDPGIPVHYPPLAYHNSHTAGQSFQLHPEKLPTLNHLSLYRGHSESFHTIPPCKRFCLFSKMAFIFSRRGLWKE